ncbi:MAG: hypothetical protein R2792_07775 [Saprospiraceae bacterium]
MECHQTDYDGTTNPDHDNIGITTDCETCHNPSGWDPALFPIHDNYYQLNGAHLAIADDCATCHNGDYNNTPNTCIECHQTDYDGANDPNHTNNQFPTDCTQCHDENAWVPASFDHSIWPLEGEHLNADCIECHTGGNYTNTPTTCVECHQTDYDGTTNPDHDNIGITTDCETCHNPSGWDPALFPIHDNYYQLNGAHLAIADDCATCHNGDYNNTPNTCIECHQTDYDGANDPNHVNNQFPTDCTQCHDENAWVPASFDHSIWPLEGEHLNADCIECHTGGDYTNTPNTCVACHQADYDGTTNPDHDNIGITTDCETCHNPSGWDPALFPIHDNYYQLNGAHLAIADDCATCHNGDYNNTPNTCIECHQTDYDGANDPNRKQSFPTDCTQCHDENAWVPASFDHSIWPLEGEHLNADCIECHTVYYTTPNTCVACHQADYDEQQPDHDNIGINTIAKPVTTHLAGIQHCSQFTTTTTNSMARTWPLQMTVLAAIMETTTTHRIPVSNATKRILTGQLIRTT